MTDMSTRQIPSQEARALAPGSDHYTAYVGPPQDYDFMGATQFRLLTTLGLRDHHRLLDFGCGSLRAGRLLIPYLNPGNYYGIEPNRWLIDDAIEREVGADQIRIKRPQFLHHDTFNCGAFGVPFDYIVAQSIFSHCGADLIARGTKQFAVNLKPHGIAAVTFIHPDTGQDPEPGQGWVYPGVVTHSVEDVAELIRAAGLHGISIPWHHPRQTWWILSRDPSRLPGPDQLSLLRGANLPDPATVERP